ncbi:MAG: thiamine phosphate synthase [Alphaproteobacteria bacterium]|nr:thiamine phosphate synthase [Alphaproteobacteria bacterium]
MLDRFYPIFDSAAWLERLVPLGIRLVQLRVKDRPEAELRAEIRAAKAVCAAHDCQFIVNDYWRLAIEEGCDYVHLGQEDLDGADLDAVRAAGLSLGVSTHDAGELDRALALAPDYVALGPVYPTILKAMRFGPQGLGRVGEWKRRVGALPLVAIGGLTVERAPGVLEAGADILSAVTDITLNPDPEARIGEWLAATRA